ncbi:MAG TPA: DoxX family protein [Candidatus Limnocylindrales bacterium]
MNVVLWIVAGLLAVAFLMVGLMKMTRPKAQLAESGLEWTEDFSPRTVKLIGTLELLAAIGLVIPAVTGIAPVLVPMAAIGLVVLMIGAIAVHIRRHEARMIVGNLVLLVLAALVAWGRLGPYAF